MLNKIINWLRRNRQPLVDSLLLVRKDKLTTGYVSEVYIDKRYVGVALDNFMAKEVLLAKSLIVADEFTYRHIDTVLVLEPNSTILPMLAKMVKISINSDYMALQC